MKRKKLPPYTVQTPNRYQYTPYTGGGRHGKRRTFVLKGADGKTLPPDSPMSAVWEAWERLQGKSRPTLSWLLRRYLDSDTASELVPSTRAEYARQAAFLGRYPLKGGRGFGEVDLRDITPGALRAYLDRRKRKGAPVAGNREVKLISVAWSWALGRDVVRLANPGKLRAEEQGAWP